MHILAAIIDLSAMLRDRSSIDYPNNPNNPNNPNGKKVFVACNTKAEVLSITSDPAVIQLITPPLTPHSSHHFSFINIRCSLHRSDLPTSCLDLLYK